MASKGAGHLFQCIFGSIVSILPGMPEGVSAAGHSPSGSHFLMGSCAGAVRVYPLPAPFAVPYDGLPFWEGQVHDMHHRVTGVTMAFDSSTITSAASDGSVFTFRLSQSIKEIAAGLTQPGSENKDHPSRAVCSLPECEDMTGTDAYTIEEAKQKVGEDALQAEAEKKKGTVREMLAQYALLLN